LITFAITWAAVQCNLSFYAARFAGMMVGFFLLIVGPLFKIAEHFGHEAIVKWLSRVLRL
jgi:hypothetical protein